MQTLRQPVFVIYCYTHLRLQSCKNDNNAQCRISDVGETRTAMSAASQVQVAL